MHIRCNLLAGISVLLLSASGVAAPQADLQAQGEWMAHFYERPEPDHLPQWLKEVAGTRGLEKGHFRFPIMVFVAEVAKRYPGKVGGWCADLAGLPSSQRASIAWSFKNAGALDARCTDGLAADDLAKLQAARPYSPLSKTPTTPGDLDMLWSVFMATGNEAAVNLIVDVLRIPVPDKPEPGSVQILLLNGAARWSLGSNAQQHPAVRAILERRAAASQGLLKEQLDAILHKAKG